jgi:hypothetical protein
MADPDNFFGIVGLAICAISYLYMLHHLFWPVRQKIGKRNRIITAIVVFQVTVFIPLYVYAFYISETFLPQKILWNFLQLVVCGYMLTSFEMLDIYRVLGKRITAKHIAVAKKCTTIYYILVMIYASINTVFVGLFPSILTLFIMTASASIYMVVDIFIKMYIVIMISFHMTSKEDKIVVVQAKHIMQFCFGMAGLEIFVIAICYKLTTIPDSQWKSGLAAFVISMIPLNTVVVSYVYNKMKIMTIMTKKKKRLVGVLPSKGTPLTASASK